MSEEFRIATLVGCAIGDALGNPFEMKPATDESLLIWDGQFKEGGTFWWGQPGQYTDDTLMSLALSASLMEYQGYNPEDVAARYLAWMESGNTRGIGGTTAQALTRIKLGASYSESGVTHTPEGLPCGGNGTAMRAAPIGLAYRNDLIKLVEVAELDASITHKALEPQAGSIAVALSVALLVNNICNPWTVLSEVESALPDSLVRDKLLLAQDCIDRDMDPVESLALIGTKGYVPETVGAAFYCLGATTTFKDAVLMAVRGGGDTDTTAAIVGAMAGTYYGLGGIPDEYKTVENFDLLDGVAQQLINIEI